MRDSETSERHTRLIKILAELIDGELNGIVREKNRWSGKRASRRNLVARRAHTAGTDRRRPRAAGDRRR